MKRTKLCPRCGKTKPVRAFGLKMVRPYKRKRLPPLPSLRKVVVQSWCRICRGAP